MRLKKSVRVQVIGSDNALLLNALISAGIAVFHVHSIDEITMELYLKEKEANNAVKLLEKKGSAVTVFSLPSIVGYVQYFVKRQFLIIGILLMAAFWLWLPTRVFFVEVTGNHKIPTSQILEAAENIGLGFGADRRLIRNERIKNALLDQIPQLQWAGVNTAGCVARIHVREQENLEPSLQPTISNMVAACDGKVLSCTVTSGTAMCKEGSIVRAGDILISGLEDFGFSLVAGAAEGEVYAQTTHHFSAIMPVSVERSCEGRRVIAEIAIRLGKKRINFFKGSGILDTGCVKMYSNYTLQLPGYFLLPVSLEIVSMQSGLLSPTSVQGSDSAESLYAFARDYLRGQMIAGNVLNGDEQLTVRPGYCRLDGHYVCKEMIGRIQEIKDWSTLWKKE